MTNQKEEWRENLHDTIKYIMGGNYEIPQVIINAIDSAYVAGLADRAQIRKETLEECKKCVPEERGLGWESEYSDGFNTCREEILTNLDNLMKGEGE